MPKAGQLSHRLTTRPYGDNQSLYIVSMDRLSAYGNTQHERINQCYTYCRVTKLCCLSCKRVMMT